MPMSAFPVAADAPLEAGSAPPVDELNRFVWRDYWKEAESSGSLEVGVFKGSGSGKRVVIVRDFYRGKEVQGADQSVTTWGVAVRLTVGVSQYSGSATLSLPVVAAEAQLRRAEATCQLDVVGYTGQSPKFHEIVKNHPVGDFTVESYARLMQAANDIAAIIMEDEGHVQPVILAYTPPPNPKISAEVRTAVGIAIALDAIRLRIPQHEMEQWIQELEDKGLPITAEVTDRAIQTYRDLVVGTTPTTDEARSAFALMAGLRLKKV